MSDKSIHDMTRDELNHWAGWFGLTTDAERFATKEEVIAAIEAANTPPADMMPPLEDMLRSAILEADRKAGK